MREMPNFRCGGYTADKKDEGRLPTCRVGGGPHDTKSWYDYALLFHGPVSFPRPDEPVARRFGLPLPPPLPHESPLKRLLLVLEVVDAPSLLLRSSSSSMLNRPCSSSILSRLMLLLLTARSKPRRPLELPILDAEVTRLIPGCRGLLFNPASSRDDKRVRCSCWLIMLIEAWRGGDAR
jgi:hypothetical protein